MRERAYRPALSSTRNAVPRGGQPMQAKNTNAGEPMEMLAVQISEGGEPLTYKAK